MRLSKDQYYLNIADAVSERSSCLRRKYGAVIVKDDQIVGTGYNGSSRGEPNCCDLGSCPRESLGVPKGERYELCEAIHAEDNAVLSAGRERTLGATIYIVGRNSDGSLASSKPCKMCRRKLINAGVARVVGLDETLEIAVDIDLNSIE